MHLVQEVLYLDRFLRQLSVGQGLESMQVEGGVPGIDSIVIGGILAYRQQILAMEGLDPLDETVPEALLPVLQHAPQRVVVLLLRQVYEQVVVAPPLVVPFVGQEVQVGLHGQTLAQLLGLHVDAAGGLQRLRQVAKELGLPPVAEGHQHVVGQFLALHETGVEIGQGQSVQSQVSVLLPHTGPRLDVQDLLLQRRLRLLGFLDYGAAQQTVQNVLRLLRQFRRFGQGHSGLCQGGVFGDGAGPLFLPRVYLLVRVSGGLLHDHLQTVLVVTRQGGKVEHFL